MNVMLLPFEVLCREGEVWDRVLGISMSGKEVLIENKDGIQRMVVWEEVKMKDWMWPKGPGGQL